MLSNQNSSISPTQQANSNVATANVSNQVPSTGKRNIVIRAFKYLADRIVAAVKFVWSKLFASKSEADSGQRSVTFKKPEDDIKKTTDKDNTCSSQTSQAHDNNPALIDQQPANIVEAQNTEGGSSDQDLQESDNFEAENDLKEKTAKDSSTDTKQANTEDDTNNNPDSFVIVAEDIAHPSGQVTHSQNEAHKNQVAVNEITDIVTSKISTVADTATTMLGQAYEWFKPLLGAIDERVFDGKSWKNISSYVDSFIQHADYNSATPDNHIRELIKFNINELKNIFVVQTQKYYKYEKPIDTLFKICSMVMYTALKLNTYQSDEHAEEAKENLANLNNMLNNIYISCVNDFVCFSYENEDIQTKEEALEQINKLAIEKFGSTYKQVTREQIEQIT
jgi:hypothetical protein